MYQLYFLSIMFNGFSGCLFLAGGSGQTERIEASMNFSFRSQTFQFILGILSAVTGIVKLFLPIRGNIPILGDLVPALAGVVAGFILIFGFFRERDSGGVIEDEGRLDRLGDAFLHYKKAIGIILIAAAVLHFLFPEALFL